MNTSKITTESTASAILVPHRNQSAALELSHAMSLLRIGMEVLAERSDTDLLCLIERAFERLEPIAIFLDAIDDEDHLTTFREARRQWVLDNAGGAE